MINISDMIAVMSYEVKSAKNNIEDFHPFVNDTDIIHNQRQCIYVLYIYVHVF
jgi:hypothetical protein